MLIFYPYRLEWLSGKLIKDNDQYTELVQLYETMKYREDEVQELLRFVDANPDVFEISEDEAIMDDCKKVLDDITNKIEKNY